MVNRNSNGYAKGFAKGVAECSQIHGVIKGVGFGLRGRWTQKNVDLKLLCKSVEAFFTERGLEARTEESSGKYNIFLFFGSRSHPARGLAMRRLVVSIRGNQKGFVVEFRGADYARSILFDSLARMFIGDLLFRRDRELEDVLLRLENEFWPYMDDTIAQLSGSSKQK